MRRIAALLMATGLLAPGTGAGAVDEEISVGASTNDYTPKVARARVGEPVRWRRSGSGNPHNVFEDHGLFRSGDPTSGPIDFGVRPSAGTFFYYCEFHGRSVMNGKLRVPVRFAQKPAGKPFTVRWATRSTDTGEVFDVQYRVRNGSWKNWRTDSSKLKGAFGKRGKPIALKKGMKLRFRARSQGTTEGASRWSPPRAFVV